MNLYELLQIDRNASKEVILMAYKALAKKYHPDINPEYLEMMKQINQAKEILTNDELRAEYDRTLDNNDNKTESSYTYEAQEDQKTEIKTVRPWKRFIAKTIDMFVLGYITGYGSEYLIPGGLLFINQIEIEFVSNIILALLVFLVEAILISMFGTTPGKWIFSIQVLSKNHKKLPIVKSIMRSFSTFIFGYGLGIPIVSLLTMFYNYDLIKNNGSTNYDHSCEAVVIIRKTSILQFVMVGIILLFVGSGFASNYLNESNAEVEPQKTEPDLAEQNNQLLDVIEKEMLKEEAEIENERKYLIKWEDELYILQEEVVELEKQLEDFPEDGDENEYNELYDYYIMKWDEFDSSYDQYSERLEKLNKKIDDFNVKYGLTN